MNKSVIKLNLWDVLRAVITRQKGITVLCREAFSDFFKSLSVPHAQRLCRNPHFRNCLNCQVICWNCNRGFHITAVPQKDTSCNRAIQIGLPAGLGIKLCLPTISS